MVSCVTQQALTAMLFMKTFEQQGVPGDMNGDGQVTAEDAALILKKLVGKDINNNQEE